MCLRKAAAFGPVLQYIMSYLYGVYITPPPAQDSSLRGEHPTYKCESRKLRVSSRGASVRPTARDAYGETRVSREAKHRERVPRLHRTAPGDSGPPHSGVRGPHPFLREGQSPGISHVAKKPCLGDPPLRPPGEKPVSFASLVLVAPGPPPHSGTPAGDSDSPRNIPWKFGIISRRRCREERGVAGRLLGSAGRVISWEGRSQGSEGGEAVRRRG